MNRKVNRRPVAFYWSERHGAKYCCVILDRSRRERVRKNGETYIQAWSREYHANTLRELRAKVRPYVLGKHVAKHCLAHVHDK